MQSLQLDLQCEKFFVELEWNGIEWRGVEWKCHLICSDRMHRFSFLHGLETAVWGVLFKSENANGAGKFILKQHFEIMKNTK